MGADVGTAFALHLLVVVDVRIGAAQGEVEGQAYLGVDVEAVGLGLVGVLIGVVGILLGGAILDALGHDDAVVEPVIVAGGGGVEDAGDPLGRDGGVVARFGLEVGVSVDLEHAAVVELGVQLAERRGAEAGRVTTAQRDVPEAIHGGELRADVCLVLRVVVHAQAADEAQAVGDAIVVLDVDDAVGETGGGGVAKPVAFHPLGVVFGAGGEGVAVGQEEAVVESEVVGDVAILHRGEVASLGEDVVLIVMVVVVGEVQPTVFVEDVAELTAEGEVAEALVELHLFGVEQSVLVEAACQLSAESVGEVVAKLLGDGEGLVALDVEAAPGGIHGCGVGAVGALEGARHRLGVTDGVRVATAEGG